MREIAEKRIVKEKIVEEKIAEGIIAKQVITEQIITENNDLLLAFINSLKEEEKGKATIEKYKRDVRRFLTYTKALKSVGELSKESVVSYKESLLEDYEASSINSMLAAINRYLGFIGREDCRVKRVRVQRKNFLEEERCMTAAEAKKLMMTAHKQGKLRTRMMIETICTTGVRVSELCAFTIKRIRKGMIQIYNKGKIRKVILTKELRVKLLQYAARQGIRSGVIFITKTGGSVDRSNFWREIKEICKAAGVRRKKGFPHNFRHLFARCYYAIDKDIVNLAAILGHSSIETTKIYTVSTYARVMKKLNQMSPIFRE